MKHLTFVALALLFSSYYSNAAAQESPHSSTWVLGWDTTYPQSSLLVNLTQPGQMQLAKLQSSITMGWCNASISDTNGKLLFYTNGLKVADRLGRTMPRGDSLNLGDGYYLQNNNDLGYPLPHAIIILPWPQHESRFAIIHEHKDTNHTYSQFLCYSVVDMNENNGFGDVVERNIQLIADTLALGGLSACRHANGRDWWILIPVANSNTIQRILLYPEGFVMDGTQNIGNMVYPRNCVSDFSPDGRKFAYLTEKKFNIPPDTIFNITTSLFRFNRNTGLLSHFEDISFWSDDFVLAGLEFSPNSRYLYAGTFSRLLQWDTDAADVSETITPVAEWDSTYYQGLALYFSDMLRAGDHKIYIKASHGSPYFHVINQPDQPGMACQVTLSSVSLPFLTTGYLPNFPNYCLADTNTGISQSIPASGVQLWPNPADEIINLKFPQNREKPSGFTLVIYNALGKLVHLYQGYTDTPSCIAVNNLPPGIYTIKILLPDEIISHTRFVKK